MSGISSGLVAVAEVGSGFSIRWTEPDYGGSCKPYDMLVRLSDAEAIINDLQNLVIAENQRKQQLEQEVAAKAAEIERLIQFATLTDGGFNERMQTISQQAERIKELETALKYAQMDADVWMRDAEGKLADRTEAYQTISKQSAALKLAKDAFVGIANVEAGKVTTSYDMRRIALAAIDALKGE